MRLTDLQCRTAKPGPKVRKLSDGGWLRLWIQPAGSRQWRFAYRFDDKQKVFAIGPYPLVSLPEARAARDEAKRLLLKGTDPNAQKKRGSGFEDGVPFARRRISGQAPARGPRRTDHAQDHLAHGHGQRLNWG